nr:mucin-2-like [Dermacentor andersoni]
MTSLSLFLLAVCLIAVQAHDLAAQTFHFGPSYPAQLQGHHGYSMSAQAHGHSSHALPAHHGSHTGHVHQAHGHVVRQGHGQFADAHLHQVAHGHQHNNHQDSAETHSATAPIASKGSVPVPMCRVKVPVHATVPAAPPTSNSGSSGIQHVGNHIANSFSHVSGKVVNPVVALLQNASVWLNRTAPQDTKATSLQHTSVVPPAVVNERQSVIIKFAHQPMTTTSVPARPSVVTNATTAPSLETAVPSSVAEVTPLSRPTTKLSTLPPVVVSTLGAPAPRARAFPVQATTIVSTAMPTSVPAELSSNSNIAVQVARTMAVSESTLRSTVTSPRTTLSTRAPTSTVHTTFSQGPLNLRANSFTISSTDLPASIPQEFSSTTRVSVGTSAAVSESTLPATVSTTETTAHAALSATTLTSTDPATPTIGSLDPRADAFTALVTSTDVPTFGPVHRQQANQTPATSVGTDVPTPLFNESNTWFVPTSAPKYSVASTFPASAPSARFTAAASNAGTTSTPPSTPSLLATRAPLTITTGADINAAPVTPSAITLPVMEHSTTPERASPQPGWSTALEARKVRPKIRSLNHGVSGGNGTI